MRAIRDKGVPQSEAGAWIRANPVKQHGCGMNGAPCDADVTSFRFCLLESDDLPFNLQLSLWSRLPLPIAAIIDSGGRSAHAWILLDCSTADEYQAKVNRIFALLARFGICRSNKNPSRLSRLPGAQRKIGKRGDGVQRLLYLNPKAIEAPIFETGRSQCR
jgi:regulatory protein RepA